MYSEKLTNRFWLEKNYVTSFFVEQFKKKTHLRARTTLTIFCIFKKINIMLS